MDNSTGPQQSQLQGPQHFRRVLSRRDLVLYGLVILTPTAPYPVFGIVQQLSGGHAALAYVVAMVAMFFTAASYGKMAAVFPSAGSTYTYAQKGLNPHAGFLAGWAMILDYFLIPCSASSPPPSPPNASSPSSQLHLGRHLYLRHHRRQPPRHRMTPVPPLGSWPS